jgi:hypothetical protein
MTEPDEFTLNRVADPPRLENRARVRAKNSAKVPGMSEGKWNVSDVGITGHMVSGQSGNAQHPPLELMDLVESVIKKYDKETRAQKPHLTPLERESLFEAYKLLFYVIINALANAQVVDIKGFGILAPIYQPNKTVTKWTGWTTKENGKRKPIIEHHMIEHFGTIGFVPDVSKKFGFELGDVYARDLPAEGLAYLRSHTAARRKHVYDLIEDRKEFGRKTREKTGQKARYQRWIRARDVIEYVVQGKGKDEK